MLISFFSLSSYHTHRTVLPNYTKFFLLPHFIPYREHYIYCGCTGKFLPDIINIRTCSHKASGIFVRFLNESANKYFQRSPSSSSSLSSVICQTTGPKPLPKQFLHIVRSRVPSFNWQYPLLSLRSSSNFLRLLPRILVTSICPFIFASITCCRRQFLRKMPNIKFYDKFHSWSGVVKWRRTDRHTYGHLWCNWYPLVESILCRQ